MLLFWALPIDWSSFSVHEHLLWLCYCEDTVIKKYIHHTGMYSYILLKSRVSFAEKPHPKNQFYSKVLVKCANWMVNQVYDFLFFFS